MLMTRARERCVHALERLLGTDMVEYLPIFLSPKPALYDMKPSNFGRRKDCLLPSLIDATADQLVRGLHENSFTSVDLVQVCIRGQELPYLKLRGLRRLSWRG